jgi:hypothetical protein
MGLGFGAVIGKSIGKALRDVGITVAAAAGVTALTVVQNPEVLTPLVAALPSAGGSLLLLAVPILAKAGIDAIKHRDKV